MVVKNMKFLRHFKPGRVPTPPPPTKTGFWSEAEKLINQDMDKFARLWLALFSFCTKNMPLDQVHLFRSLKMSDSSNLRIRRLIKNYVKKIPACQVSLLSV